ncbi:hypothetical protein O8C99_00085 [Aliarcobacter butzleri]|uniref:hypothetical protein n=1 Tax=Aliarcobacter butzleri TaxID=28197 RepID=UPI00263DCBD1|nr:hypothetical protein [Aliarcobacter butzleri]MDN5101574.1 hypothetical protein [Aliarcobacter butzleri]
MNYYKKNKKPKRDDEEYIEMQNFEDYELINNFCYEAAIRTKEIINLGQKFHYCMETIDKINKDIKYKKYLKSEEFKKSIEEDKSMSYMEDQKEILYKQKSPAEKFEEELKTLESYHQYSSEQFELEEDFQIFKNKSNSILKEKNQYKIYKHEEYLCDLIGKIYKLVKYKYYLDFFERKEEKKVEYFCDYLESSLYIKREYEKQYYIETIIDSENSTITRTMNYLTKRKLCTDHILKFSSNHLFLPKQSMTFLENFFKVDKKYLKSKKTIADCFFCYDYYVFRKNEVEQKNKEKDSLNFNNTNLNILRKEIELIEKDSFLTAQQKNEKMKNYKEEIKKEMIEKEHLPSLNKKSKFYIFNENNFQKSGINKSTAFRYYTWISPYIQKCEYIKIINYNI